MPYIHLENKKLESLVADMNEKEGEGYERVAVYGGRGTNTFMHFAVMHKDA